jgi:mucin-19
MGGNFGVGAFTNVGTVGTPIIVGVVGTAAGVGGTYGVGTVTVVGAVGTPIMVGAIFGVGR